MDYEIAWNDMKKWLDDGIAYMEKCESETSGIGACIDMRSRKNQ